MKKITVMISMLCVFCVSGATLAGAPISSLDGYSMAHEVLAQVSLDPPLKNAPESTSAATPNTVCPVNGAVSKDASGFVLSCMQDHWSTLITPK